MNVYIYGGQDRFSATNSLVSGNQMPLVGKNYTVDLTEGILVVVWPNKDKSTEFGFKYWVGEYRPVSWSTMIRNWDFDYPNGTVVFVVMWIVLAVFATILIICLYCWISKCFNRATKVETLGFDPAQQGTKETPRELPHIETSGDLEEDNLYSSKTNMLAAHHEKHKTRNGGLRTLDVEMTVSGSREMSRNGSSKYM